VNGYVSSQPGVNQYRKVSGAAIVSTKLPLKPFDLTDERSLAHGSRLSFMLGDVSRFGIGAHDSIESPLGPVPSDKAITQSGLRLETSATDVVK